MAEKKITNKEVKKEVVPRKNEEWLDLCAWIERELFQYDSLTHLKTSACLSLMGLRHGKAVANNKTPNYGDYPYKVIKMAFIANKHTILDAIRNKDFNGSESTKMRYICAIMRDRIDDVYLRYMNAQKSEEKIETMETDTFEYQGAEYKSKAEANQTQSKLDDKFKELW